MTGRLFLDELITNKTKIKIMVILLSIALFNIAPPMQFS